MYIIVALVLIGIAVGVYFLTQGGKKRTVKPSGGRTGNLDLTRWKVQTPAARASQPAEKMVPPYYRYNVNQIDFFDIKGGKTTSDGVGSRTELVYDQNIRAKQHLKLRMRVNEVDGERICIAQVFSDKSGSPRSMVHYYKGSGNIRSRIKTPQNDGNNVYEIIGQADLGEWFTLEAWIDGSELKWKCNEGAQVERMHDAGKHRFKFGIYGDGGRTQVQPYHKVG